MSDNRVSFGWIMQPALFDTPPGMDSRDIKIARDMIATNERHIALVKQAGVDTIWVEDHMGWGEKAHLECFTNMAWLAGRNPGLRFGTMVCGQAFRNPAYLAKLSANMYLLTEGRFILGLGAGNNPGEHYEYGYEFLAPAGRVAQLEDTVKICQALWSESPATFEGKYYAIHGAYSSPRPDSPIPIMIGGMGEQKLLKLVAQYADWWCCDIAAVEVFTHKNVVLNQHCETVGRDPAEITRSISTWISIAEDSSKAARWDNLHITAGDPDEVTAQLETYREAGVQHFQLRFIDYPNSAGLELFLSKVLPRMV